jgi:heparan-alpha-glucosaminide N-acetyltransferase
MPPRISRRLASVDVFRALTMFLMIFVNDLGTLRDIPGWLEHAAKTEDRMGLADVVFPAFLFIVGLSIPFAIGNREAKGYSRQSTFMHILTRSLALLIIGIFHVNLENYDGAAALLPKPIWEIGITLAFFLVWLDYSPQMAKQKKRILQGCGIGLLVVLALLYKGDPDDMTGPSSPVNYIWMTPQWYGILGLIGWSYLLCAIVYFLAKDRLSMLAGAFVFFLGFNIASRLGWLHFLDPIREYVWLVSGGALPSITMAGVVATVIYRKSDNAGKRGQGMLALAIIAMGMLAGGFLVRPIWAISKIRASPSWVLICIGISLVCFVILIYLMDIKGKESSMKLLKPAGTSTLTCYLLPYFHYSILVLLGQGILLPLVLRTGAIGIVKSLLYAFVIILITGWLEKKRLRLSI